MAVFPNTFYNPRHYILEPEFTSKQYGDLLVVSYLHSISLSCISIMFTTVYAHTSELRAWPSTKSSMIWLLSHCWFNLHNRAVSALYCSRRLANTHFIIARRPGKSTSESGILHFRKFVKRLDNKYTCKFV